MLDRVDHRKLDLTQPLANFDYLVLMCAHLIIRGEQNVDEALKRIVEECLEKRRRQTCSLRWIERCAAMLRAKSHRRTRFSLGKMVGVDKRIATPETAKCLFPAWESNRIVSDPPSWTVV